MKVRAIASFFGVEEKRYIKLGETLEISEERAQRAIARGLVEAVSEEKPKRKGRKPKEDKAKRPEENKGAE